MPNNPTNPQPGPNDSDFDGPMADNSNRRRRLRNRIPFTFRAARALGYATAGVFMGLCSGVGGIGGLAAGCNEVARYIPDEIRVPHISYASDEVRVLYGLEDTNGNPLEVTLDSISPSFGIDESSYGVSVLYIGDTREDLICGLRLDEGRRPSDIGDIVGYCANKAALERDIQVDLGEVEFDLRLE
jgi:hypothetical protein